MVRCQTHMSKCTVHSEQCTFLGGWVAASQEGVGSRGVGDHRERPSSRIRCHIGSLPNSDPARSDTGYTTDMNHLWPHRESQEEELE